MGLGGGDLKCSMQTRSTVHAPPLPPFDGFNDKDGSAQQKEEHWDGNLGRKRGRRLEPKHHPNTADFHLTSSTQSSILAVIPYPPSE